jgi:Methyltransferase FkbM domain
MLRLVPTSTRSTCCAWMACVRISGIPPGCLPTKRERMDRRRLVAACAGDGHRRGVDYLGRDQKKKVKVPLTTIDILAAELGLQGVDFIKMDIEGAEKAALRGGRGDHSQASSKNDDRLGAPSR